jgi:hypothetical protein
MSPDALTDGLGRLLAGTTPPSGGPGEQTEG